MNIKFTSLLNVPFEAFTQGYIAQGVKAIKNYSKWRGLSAFVQKALEHRSPCQDMLLLLQ